MSLASAFTRPAALASSWSHTESECAAHERYMQRDVRVTLGAARPAWLAAAMDHRADGTTRELLEQMESGVLPLLLLETGCSEAALACLARSWTEIQSGR